MRREETRPAILGAAQAGNAGMAAIATAPGEALSMSSPFARNGFHGSNGRSKPSSDGSSTYSSIKADSRGASKSCSASTSAKRLSDVLEDCQMKATSQASPHQAQTSEPIGEEDEPVDENNKGILSWIRRFTNLGRRTQSSIEIPRVDEVITESLQADVPRRSYSESELGPRRRVACEYVRPSTERPHGIGSRRSAETSADAAEEHGLSDDEYGRPSLEEKNYQAMMKRRQQAYEQLFTNKEGDNHFLNEELAARSSLFNSGS
ncbi:hypothetical protein WJX84_011473 [Apatococcus fuscideae]|uniref:Uncharacterized protein n=1 Tax=Apatococcus fuscideae TaxID=2026836 RepID=A0AAW1TDR1_9CHLO